MMAQKPSILKHLVSPRLCLCTYMSVCFSCCFVDAHCAQRSKRTFPAAVNFTDLYHVLHSVVNYRSVLVLVQSESVIDVWLSGARLTRSSHFNYFWMWLWNGSECVCVCLWLSVTFWHSLPECRVREWAVGRSEVKESTKRVMPKTLLKLMWAAHNLKSKHEASSSN